MARRENPALRLAARGSWMAGIAMIAPIASAQTTIRWVAPVDGSWSVSSNWTPTNVPNTSSENAVLGLVGSYTVTFDLGTTTVRSLSLTNPAAKLIVSGQAGAADRNFIVQSDLVNEGTIVLDAGAGTGKNILFFSKSAFLRGAGQLILAEQSEACLTVSTLSSLTNEASHTIRGTGVIPQAGILYNKGLVLADITGQTLDIGWSNNTGQMQAVNGGILQLSRAVNQGLIQAQSGSTVKLVPSLGSKSNNAAGMIEAVPGGVVELSQLNQGPTGVVRAAGGVVQFANVSTSDPVTGGTIDSAGDGVIRVRSTAALSNVVMAGRWEVGAPDATASGRVILTGGPYVMNGIMTLWGSASPGGTTFEATAPSTIDGAGEFILTGPQSAMGRNCTLSSPLASVHGAGSVYLAESRGSIAADVPGGTLILHGLTNYGAIRAVPGATLRYESSGSVGNAGLITIEPGATFTCGTLSQSPTGRVDARGSAVSIAGSSIFGGLADVSGGGRMVLAPNAVARMGAGVTVNGDWEFELYRIYPENAELQLFSGGMFNNGVINLDAREACGTLSVVAEETTLLGGTGELAMRGFAWIKVTKGTLTHGPDHTIRGSGSVGLNSAGKVVNQGRIIADDPTRQLSLGSTENQGLIHVTNGGSLGATSLVNSGVVRIDHGGIVNSMGFAAPGNVGRVIVGEGSQLTGFSITQGAAGELIAGPGRIEISTIRGGTLRSEGGDIVLRPGKVGKLDGTTLECELTVEGTLTTGDTTLQVLAGGVTNNGLIRLAPPVGAGYTDIECTASSTLAGTGSIRLEAARSRLYLNSGSSMTHGAAHEIVGSGIITGTTTSRFLNHGTIRPGLPIGTLTINNLSQQPTGVVEIEIVGDAPLQHDQLVSTRTMNLGGTLRVRFVDGYAMMPCGSHVIISGGVINGRFANIDAPQMPVGALGIRYEPGLVTLVYAPADYDGSTFVDTDDFTAFISDFEAGAEAADIDHSGFVDTDDFTAFVLAFEAGC